MAGTAWHSKVLVERVFKMEPGKKEPKGSSSFNVEAIDHAAAQGARIINMSLGGYSDSLKNAVCPAVANAAAQGLVVVASAGNDGHKGLSYPASCPGVISVAATGADGLPTDFTNHGDRIDVAAPGEGIWSTALVGTGNGLIDCRICSSSGYARASGTSMASPFVAAAAAQMLGRFPDLTPAQVKTRLKASAKRIDHYKNVGAGLVDAMGAVMDASFEDLTLGAWTRTGTVATVGSPVPHGDRALFLSTNDVPGGTSQVTQKLTFKMSLGTIIARIRFAVVTDLAGPSSRHRYEIRVRSADGKDHVLAAGRVSDLPKSPFDGGGKWSGWKNVEVEFNAPAGDGELRLMITDTADPGANSVLLADDFRFAKPFGVVLP